MAALVMGLTDESNGSKSLKIHSSSDRIEIIPVVDIEVTGFPRTAETAVAERNVVFVASMIALGGGSGAMSHLNASRVLPIDDDMHGPLACTSSSISSTVDEISEMVPIDASDTLMLISIASVGSIVVAVASGKFLSTGLHALPIELVALSARANLTS